MRPGDGIRIVALVPMRHDSERVPGKNRRDFAGAPLYHHIVRTLLGCPSVDEVVIDTDSDEIMRECGRVFPEVRLIDRPGHLRGGHVPMNDVLKHDVAEVGADFYLQTHATNPLLTGATIERAIEEFLSARPGGDSLFSVTRLQSRLYDASGKPINHDPSRLERTQDLAPVFEENSNIYIFSRETVLERGARIGRSPIFFEMHRIEAMDIDEEQDFRMAEALYLARESGAERSDNLIREGAV